MLIINKSIIHKGVTTIAVSYETVELLSVVSKGYLNDICNHR